ncbi:hypothetical protein ACN47E_002031 [Coniothyrium glycines]
MPLPKGFTAIGDVKGTGDKVSILGIVVSHQLPRPTRGTDWCLDFELQDEFQHAGVGGHNSIRCRVFRAREKLPTIAGTGDVVLLRNVKTSLYNGHVDCVSDSKSYSGMLVFPAAKIPVPELSQAYQLGSQRLPYTAAHGTNDATVQEQMAVIHLKHAASASDPQRKQYAVATASRPSARDKLCLVKDMDFKRFYDVRVQVVNFFPGNYANEVELKVSDYTENGNLHNYVHPDDETHYMPAARGWKGPWGQYTLNVILWEANAAWARDNVQPGDYVFLRNMHTKMSRYSKLEGAIHQDRDDGNKVDIRKLVNQDDIAAIEQRREAYERKEASRRSAPQDPQNDRADLAVQKSSKKAEKRKRARERKEAEGRDLQKKHDQWSAACNGINVNVRAAYPEMKLSTISEIVYSKHLRARSIGKHTDFTLPFVNVRHRSRVRVVDVWPKGIELFTHSPRDSQWMNPPELRAKERWEWGFVLLLEDAKLPPDTVAERLRVVVDNGVAQGLLKQDALNLKQNPRIVQRLEEIFFLLWGNMMELKTDLMEQGKEHEWPLKSGDARLQNKPFDCCIEEYGHPVPVSDANPMGYQRMHRLAQTFIEF